MAPSTRLACALVMAGLVRVSIPGIAQDVAGLPPETLAQSTPVYAFHSQGNHPGLIFTRSGGAQETDPRLFVSSRDGGWRLVQLPDELHNASWVFAGRASAGNGEIWGITQNGQYLQLVTSNNDGRNWKVRGGLQKISKAAVLDLFSMNEEGRGTLILRLDADPAPNAPRLGYYLYISKNGGRSWSESMYSQGKPIPPPSLLAPPDRTFEDAKPLDAGAWQRLLADLQPAG
jgi:hypothetical protein